MQSPNLAARRQVLVRVQVTAPYTSYRVHAIGSSLTEVRPVSDAVLPRWTIIRPPHGDVVSDLLVEQ